MKSLYNNQSLEKGIGYVKKKKEKSTKELLEIQKIKRQKKKYKKTKRTFNVLKNPYFHTKDNNTKEKYYQRNVLLMYKRI